MQSKKQNKSESFIFYFKNQNFLTAGYHVGINTVGTSLRNGNMQLRSEPINPQIKVSPWNQTTIQPDLNRRPLDNA